jgi:hypothetical protein
MFQLIEAAANYCDQSIAESAQKVLVMCSAARDAALQQFAEQVLTKLREDNADIFSKLDAFQNEFSQKLEALVESKVETSGINFRAYTDRLFFDLETRTGTEFTRLRSQLWNDVNSSYLQLKADIVLAQSQAVSCAQSALLRVQRDTIHLNDASRLAAAAETEALEQRIELNVGDFEHRLEKLSDALLKSVSSATGRIFNLRAHVSDQFAALKTDISDLRTQLVQTATSVPDLKPISDRVDAIAIQLAHVPAHADDDHSTHALIAKLEMELSTLRTSLLKLADKQAPNKLAADVLDRAPKGETRAQFEACLADIESISTRLQKLESHTATQHGDEHKSFAGFALKSELSQLRSRFHELEVLVAGSKSGPAGAVAARHAAPTDDLKALLSRVSAVEASLATLKQSDDVDSAAYPVGHDVPALHSQLNEVQSLASAAWDLLDEAGKEIDALKAHIKSQDARIDDLVTKIASFANLLGAGHDSAVHADEQSDPDDPVSRVKQRLARNTLTCLEFKDLLRERRASTNGARWFTNVGLFVGSIQKCGVVSLADLCRGRIAAAPTPASAARRLMNRCAVPVIGVPLRLTSLPCNSW